MTAPSLVTVRALVVHNDEQLVRRQPGTQYDASFDRAKELATSGKVTILSNLPGDPHWAKDVSWTTRHGRILSPLPQSFPVPYVAHPRPAQVRTLQVTRYDPGSAVYRYHSALNTAPGGQSALVRWHHTNPFCDLRQFDGDTQRTGVTALFDTADIVHVHLDYAVCEDAQYFGRFPRREDQLLVMHYHGMASSPYAPLAKSDFNFERDRELGAVLIGARLYHAQFPGMTWLPIPMPVKEYAALRREVFVPRAGKTPRPWRICHAPTNPPVKGTAILQQVVAELQKKKLPVELVYVQRRSHADTLRIKASCDITFDSFWMGIQGNGLEAACMGQPVIAGDAELRAQYVAEFGECPYTFADDAVALREQLERLMTDVDYFITESSRVNRYVTAVHDYPVVGEKYWSLMARKRLTLSSVGPSQ